MRNSLEDFYRARYLLFPEKPELPEDMDIEEKRYLEALDDEERALLRLHIGDEYLITQYFLGITYYLLGERDAARHLAVETLPLCEQYGYLDGVELRRRLLDDRRKLVHSMERFQWIRDYVRNYLWI